MIVLFQVDSLLEVINLGYLALSRSQLPNRSALSFRNFVTIDQRTAGRFLTKKLLMPGSDWRIADWPHWRYHTGGGSKYGTSSSLSVANRDSENAEEGDNECGKHV